MPRSTPRALHPTPRRNALALFLAFAIGAPLAHAQVAAAAFAGTFAVPVPNGEAIVTLTVAERVTGALTGPGLAVDLVGDLDPGDGAVRGVATTAGESVRFEATLRGDLLTLVLHEVGADGRPNPHTAVALELRRASSRRTDAATGAAGMPSKAAPASGVATLTPDLVQAVHEAVEEALTLPESLLELAIDAALEAGRLDRSGIALAGTLRQGSDGALRFARDASDALRLVLLDGSVFTIAFLVVPQGHLADDGDAFVANPHLVDVRVAGPGADGPFDLRMTSSPLAQDGTQDVRLSGRFTRANATWEVDARLERFERYVVDGIVDGEVRVQGRLTLGSADLGATVTSTRSYRYRIVNVVENIDQMIDTNIVLAGDRVRLSGRVFVAFREARPVDRDQWVVQGGLTRDGTALGAFRPDEGPTALRVVLELGGASVPLFAFPF